MPDEPKRPAPGSGETDDIDSLLKAIEETKKEPARPPAAKEPVRPPAPAPAKPAALGPAQADPAKAADSITKFLATGGAPVAAGGAAGSAAPALPPVPPGALQKPAFPPADAPAARTPEAGLDLLKDVNLHVKVELGRARMRVKDILQLGSGSVVPLDKLAGDPLDVYVNGRLVARGEVLVLKDNFCIRITEIVNSAP